MPSTRNGTLTLTPPRNQPVSPSHPREAPQNTSLFVCFQSSCFNKGRCGNGEGAPLFNHSSRLWPHRPVSSTQPSMTASLSRRLM